MNLYATLAILDLLYIGSHAEMFSETLAHASRSGLLAVAVLSTAVETEPRGTQSATTEGRMREREAKWFRGRFRLIS